MRWRLARRLSSADCGADRAALDDSWVLLMRASGIGFCYDVHGVWPGS